MTSAYERPSEGRPYRLWGGGGASRGKPRRGSKECHLFSAGFVRKNFGIRYVNERSGRCANVKDRVYLKYNMKENDREQELN